MQMRCLLVENKVYKTNNVFNNLYLMLKLTFVIKMRSTKLHRNNERFKTWLKQLCCLL